MLVMFRAKYKLQYCLKLFYLVFCRGLRFCCFVIMNIVYVCRVSLQNVLKWTRTKKITLVLTVLTIVLFIFWRINIFNSQSPSWSNGSQIAEQSRKFKSCLSYEHLSFQKLIDSYGAFVNHVPILPNEKLLLPYVGNGYISLEVDLNTYIHIKHEGFLNSIIPYSPVINVRSTGDLWDTRSVVLNVQHGLVHHIQCFEVDDYCANVKSVLYAHRRRPSLLVQEIYLSNPSTSSLEFAFDWRGFQEWPSTNIVNSRVKNMNVTSGSAIIKSYDGAKEYAVVVSGVVLPSKMKLKSGASLILTSMTFVTYKELSVDAGEGDTANLMENMMKESVEALYLAYSTPLKIIRQEHSSAWLSLWSSGFYISNSLASGVVNGDRINKTMYFVLSSTRSPLLELNTPADKLKEAQTMLYSTDRCYGEHHTLQNMKMWSDLLSVDDVINIARIWFITLRKHGCGKMMDAGAEGVLQAMILSYGALRFNHNHLEFCTQPKDLHRDLHFRRINYGSDTHVNISVRVGADNKASLYVSLDRNNLTYHACDAGCLDPPVKLSNEEIVLPVKLTDPITPILYITSDLQHMEELRHAIHVQSVDEAPAHEHHIIIMHKHGHKWGGLPIFFWVIISTLIGVFHLFLFKLVYNEYCSQQDIKTFRSYHGQQTRRYI